MHCPLFGINFESCHRCVLRWVSVALKEREARLEWGSCDGIALLSDLRR